MTRRSLARRLRADDEHGAVVVLVAICIVAIFALAVLTIDVGGMFVKRRQMVNGADAAALAVGQECADRTPPGNYEVQADTFAGDNVPGLTATDGGVTDIVNCDTGVGHATVQYQKSQELFFGPVLGLGNSRPVTATATVVWGPLGSSPNPVPLVLNLSTFQGDCDIPNVAVGQTCYLWYDNDDFNGSSFGFLALDQWDMQPTDSCNSAGSSTLQDWIDGRYTGPILGLNYPDPTYVCTVSGNTNSAFQQLANHNGEILTFPINDQTQQIMNNSQIYMFDIIGFASMQLDAVYKANQAPPECGSPPNNSSSHCIIIEWQGYQFGTGGDPCTDCQDFGTFGYRLCDIPLGTCPPGT
jgi:Flp pilus assembly protein TadG